MHAFVVIACAGIFLLAQAPCAAAQAAAPVKKSAPDKARKTFRAAKTTTKKPEGVLWTCEFGNTLRITGDMTRDQVITVHWKRSRHLLPRQATSTGADRYFDPQTGFDLLVIPDKAMLFNRKAGRRLADECKTQAMAAGAPASTQAGALRAPASLPLMLQDPAAPDAVQPDPP